MKKQLLLLALLMLMPLLASADPVEINGIYYNMISKDIIEVTKHPNGYSGNVVIPKTITFKGVTCNVTRIGDYAFCGSKSSKGLTSVTIPNSVTVIGEGAFEGCDGLSSLTIPNSVAWIGESAFMFCSGLTSLTIPNSVKWIWEHAFTGCTGLISVTLPSSAVVDEYAFCGCIGLTSVTIPDGWSSIGDFVFKGCTGLTSVTIPNSVKYIDRGAFEGCKGLTSVTIPNSVTNIGEYAFFECTALATVTIGNGVTSIGSKAFAKCSELKDVYCYAGNVPNTNSDAFADSYIGFTTLHVPKGCVDAYKTVEPWKSFMDIVEIVSKVKLNKSKATVEKGKTLTLKATVSPTSLSDKSVIWKSSNTKVATVTSVGKVKGVKAGTATITCTSKATGAKATCKVTVGSVSLNMSEVAVNKGKTVTLKATVYPTSLSDKSVTWKSSKTSVATVTSSGKVKGVKYGTATITCTSKATGLSTTCKVTVGSVSLDKSKATVKTGKTVTLKATVYPTSLSDKSVTWKSSNTKVATVTSSGKVKGVKAGTVTITCTSVATGLTATCKVIVKASSSTRSLDGDDDDEVTGIEEIEEASAVVEPFDVYDLSGRKVLNGVTSLDGLPNGIYIVNGKKIMRK